MGSKKVVFLNPVEPRLNVGCHGKDGSQENTEDGNVCARCECRDLQEIVQSLPTKDALHMLSELADDFRKGMRVYLAQTERGDAAGIHESLDDRAMQLVLQWGSCAATLVQSQLLHPREAELVSTVLQKGYDRNHYFGPVDIRPVQRAVFYCVQRPMAIYREASVQPGYGYFEFVNALAYYVLTATKPVSPREIIAAIDAYKPKYDRKEKQAVFAFCLGMYCAGEWPIPDEAYMSVELARSMLRYVVQKLD